MLASCMRTAHLEAVRRRRSTRGERIETIPAALLQHSIHVKRIWRMHAAPWHGVDSDVNTCGIANRSAGGLRV